MIARKRKKSALLRPAPRACKGSSDLEIDEEPEASIPTKSWFLGGRIVAVERYNFGRRKLAAAAITVTQSTVREMNFFHLPSTNRMSPNPEMPLLCPSGFM